VRHRDVARGGSIEAAAHGGRQGAKL